MPILLQKLISGAIAGFAGAIVLGFVVGMFTLFLGSPLGAVVGYGLGFWWGFKRVEATAGIDDQDSAIPPPKAFAQNPSAAPGASPKSVGDTAFLLGGGFGMFWLGIVISDLGFGYSSAHRGHPMGVVLMLAGLLLAPGAGRLLERQAHRRLASPLRDIAGIGFIILLLWTVAVWWHWAEARDQATSYRPRPIAAQQANP